MLPMLYELTIAFSLPPVRPAVGQEYVLLLAIPAKIPYNKNVYRTPVLTRCLPRGIRVLSYRPAVCPCLPGHRKPGSLSRGISGSVGQNFSGYAFFFCGHFSNEYSTGHAILLRPSFILFYYTPLTCFYQISAVNVSIDQISSYVFYEFVFVWFLLADDHQVADKKILTWIIFNSFYPDSTKPDYQIEAS